MLDDTRVGTAMLTLRLRAAVQEAVQTEALSADRDSSRNELRGRLAVLVDRRRTNLAAELATERKVAAQLIDAARREARVIVEAAAIVESATIVESAATSTAAPSELNGRARSAQLSLQLRAALQRATDAEREEVTAIAANDRHQHNEQMWAQRRDELDQDLAREQDEAAALISAAHAQGAVLAAAAQPVAGTPLEADFEAERVPVPVPQLPAQQLPVNIVIDAEAFARVFAAVFASMQPQVPQQFGAQPYPTQVYSVGQFPLPQPSPLPMKQSFWSHAKHIDVLLLSAAMVIVLVVLAAWLA